MKIRSISTTSYKNLSLNNTHVHAATLVVGKNGQGKTNLLRLLDMALRAKANIGTKDQSFLLEGSLAETGLVRFGAEKATVSLKFECEGPRHAGVIEALKDYGYWGNESTARITFDVTETRNGSVWQVTLLKIGVIEVVGPNAAKLSSGHAELVRKYVNDEWCGSAVYVPLGRLPLDHRPRLQLGTVADPARDLPNAIYGLINNASELESTIDFVRKVMQHFFKVSDVRASVEQREVGDQKVSFVSIKVKEDSGHWVPLSDVGAGLQQLLVVATILYRARAQILLVEEFETSLSLEFRGDLWKEFRSMVAGGIIHQVVASSHTFWKSEEPTQVTIGPTSLTERRGVDFQKWQKVHWDAYEGQKALPPVPPAPPEKEEAAPKKVRVTPKTVRKPAKESS